MFRPGDLFEDFAGRFGPDEGLGVGIVVLQVFHDGALEFGDALERAAPDTVSGDLGKEAFNHIEPRRRSRCEVEMEARVRLKPTLHAGGLMGGVVVSDQMKIETGRGLLIGTTGLRPIHKDSRRSAGAAASPRYCDARL